MASAVLQHVTNKKLAKLSARQEKYEAQRKELLAFKAESDSALEYSRYLLDSIKKLGLANRHYKALSNHDLFLRQAETDASVPPETILQWQHELENLLQINTERYEYAALFGKLVTEWLENPNDANKQLAGLQSTESPLANASDMTDFEPVGREEMHEQRRTWESIAFTDRKVDTDKLNRYLTSLFGNGTSSAEDVEITPFDTLRKNMTFRVDLMNPDLLKKTIQGVLRSDLFAGPKRAALLDLKDRPEVLEEMVDVLNIEIRALEDWQWENTAVPVVLRRQVNGKYRFFMDEEIHQALLLHYVGSAIAERLRTQFLQFYKSAWSKRERTGMTEEAIKRRAYFLQELRNGPGRQAINLIKPHQSIDSARINEYAENYFLVQMPDEDGVGDYNGGDESSTKPVNIKQSLLEYLTTDMHLRLDVHGEFCAVQTDLRWFGPSLAHSTILTVLKFFGLSKALLTFCKTYLEVPVLFVQDGPGATPTKRKAGIPMSHCLSDAMGEAVLFCLDYAVNQATKGGNLIRFHDDLWYWGDAEKCRMAWEVINDFCRVTGLELNEEKTGSVNMSTGIDQAHIPGLPEGPVKWGFLKLDSHQHRWVVDRAQVDLHIIELRRQLDACRSIFAFVQAWNAYVSRFFINNFARVANCHGPDHLQAVLETFQHIQKEMFPSGSVTAHIKHMIKERFGVCGVPTGFLYFPTELGGLDLRNPFITLMSRMQIVDETIPPEDRLQKKKAIRPKELLAVTRSRERHAYEKAKARFDQDKATFTTLDGWKPADADTFFSYEEYSAFRDELSTELALARDELQAQPGKVDVSVAGDLQKALLNLRGFFSERGWERKEDNKWTVALYGPEILQRFGDLCIADRELLPVGLVNVLRGEKVRWAG
ncbi:hypothetical protein ANO11243_007490 [Dothideomycetidae sp. 11243]|nr:hypothetical protein ANO11243_007490 [fungal sp. No.11243]